jgi:hypothetical protein
MEFSPFLGFLVFGLSREHLWFEQPGGKKEIIVRTEGRVAACRCPACRITIIDERDFFEEKMAYVGRRIGQTFRRWKEGRSDEKKPNQSLQPTPIPPGELGKSSST